MPDFEITRSERYVQPLMRHERPESVRRLSRHEPEQASLAMEYLRMLFRRRWLVCFFAFAGALLGIILSLPKPLVYQARTSLDIQGLNENFMNMRAVDPKGLPSGYPAEAYLMTQIKLVQSESMLSRVANRMKQTMPPKPHEANDKFSELKRRFGWKVKPPESFEHMVEEVAKTVKVRPIGMTRLVEASCESSSAQMAADFCNTLANEFIDQDMEVRWDTAQKTSEYLTRQLQDVRKKLEASEHLLQNYAQQSTLLFSADKESVAQEKLRQLQAELSRAQADRVAKQAQYELVASVSPESLPPVLDSGPLREYQMRLGDLRGQRAELSASFTTDYPKVRRLDAQIRELESTMVKERANVIERVRNEHAAARQREALLTTAYANQEKVVSALVPKAAQYNMLLREVESGRQLYETLLQRVKEAGFMSAMRSSPVRVVDAARTPTMPGAPNRRNSAAAGLALGSLAGIALAFFRERTDRRLRMPGDATTHLHVRELGVIPAASLQDLSERKSWLPRPAGGSNAPSLLAPVPRGNSRKLELVTWKHKGSLMAESYRAVMSSLLFAEAGTGRPAVKLVITSPSVGEGKTTLASNLAIALAQTNRRVILVDGDLRKPRLHDIFDVPNHFGLSDILRGEVDVRTCPLAMLAQPTLVPGLFVLPSGSPIDDAASALFSTSIEALMERLGKEFGTVLIDSPPMHHLSDARVLARYTDGVVLVFRAGITTRESAMVAQDTYAADRTTILGIVLNDFNPSKESWRNYYDGYYRYQRQKPA